jgi:pentatricopeptide repeat protein|mmetsp:Transcript_108097/g.170870  ORF Transcript_108097/g.170870 Transcript_108097/m.170870 type:complete len:614 (+) Transcript_108097:94-1935(+)
MKGNFFSFNRSAKLQFQAKGLCCLSAQSFFQWPWSRHVLVVATTLLTVAVFSLDMVLNDFSSSSTWHWLTGDGGLLFYVLGFGSAYAYLRGFGFGQRPPRNGKTAPKRERTDRSPRAASAARKAPQNKLSACTDGAFEFVPNANGSYHATVSIPSPVEIERLPSSSAAPSSRVNYAISQVAARGPDRMVEVLESHESSGSEPDVTSYNLIIRAYTKCGDLRNAERWLKRMVERGVKPTEYSFNTLMNAYAKSDDVASVERWMNQMIESDVTASGVSFAIVIHASARRGDVETARSWLLKMISSGLQPDCVNYNSLIHACSVRKDADGAEYWFQQLVSHGLEPTVMTYTALVDACSKSLEVKKAEKWMNQLLKLGLEPNVVSFSAMIDACARVGDLEKAEHWHTKMLELGVHPNAYIYSALINACAQSTDVAAASEWLRRAEKSGTTLDAVVYGCVINACGKAGDAPSAMSAFRQMRSQGIATHVVVYGALARPFAYQGDWEEVERIHDEMVADGIALNDYFLYTMLLAYSRAKPRRGDRAEATFRKALNSGVQPNDRVVKALSSAVGRARCASILQSCGLEQLIPSPRDAASAGHKSDLNNRRTSRSSHPSWE